MSSGALPQSGARAALSPATATSYTFTTVDDPASQTNRVAAINNGGTIVGDIGSGTVSDPTSGYESSPPYTHFTQIKYSNALDTVVSDISNSASNPIIVGDVVGVPNLVGTWGLVDAKGVLSLLKDRKEGGSNFAVTEFLGVNDSQFGVGFFTNSYGNNVPFIVNIPQTKYTLLKPPSYQSAEGTGINSVNHIVGWEIPLGGNAAVGFYLRNGAYTTVAYPGAQATYPMSINSSDQIAGYYEDATGGFHGFIETNPTGKPTWQTIDDPNAASGKTFVDGINDSDQLCGYYRDPGGVQHGFVATP
jgi:hypothetical protein